MIQVSAGAGLIGRVAGSEEGVCPMGLVSRQQMDADVDFYALWLEDADDTSERGEPEDGAPFVAACGQRVYLRSGGHTHTPAPAARRLRAIPSPMAPRPTTPTRAVGAAGAGYSWSFMW